MSAPPAAAMQYSPSTPPRDKKKHASRMIISSPLSPRTSLRKRQAVAGDGSPARDVGKLRASKDVAMAHLQHLLLSDKVPRVQQRHRIYLDSSIGTDLTLACPLSLSSCLISCLDQSEPSPPSSLLL